MPNFKYTIANKEGKNLSGIVEAPDEITARTELNNLGFSILTLEEAQEAKEEQTGTKFVFEAIDKNSKMVSGTIPAETDEVAYKKLTEEYTLTVTAIWKEGSTEEEIEAARTKWSQKLQADFRKIEDDIEINKIKSTEQKKEEIFLKRKIEEILRQVHELLIAFDNDFNAEQKAEINKRINKLLRIKNSTNLKYIEQTAEELLLLIQAQEKELREKGFHEKRLRLEVKTKKLLNQLHRSSSPQSIGDDIVEKIEEYETEHVGNKRTITLLDRVKEFFTTPPEIKIIKEQIKVYNKQLFDFAKLYFKEPTKEYKDKVKASLGTIWRARKKAVNSLKHAKELRKLRKNKKEEQNHLVLSFMDELNLLTGWLLGFYILYYFVSLYITTKDFGLSTIPKGLIVYESQFFKYILGILFLLHAATSLKTNFFRKSYLANVALPAIFAFGSIIIILNF